MNLYLDNSNVVELRGLKDLAIGDSIEDATVRVMAITDAGGNTVAGQVFPVSMPHAGSSTYRATLNHDIAIVRGRAYYALVHAVTPGGVVGNWKCPVTAEVRACS